MPGRKRGSGGFKSKAQWRMFFANPKLRRYAREKAHKSRPYKSLPGRTRMPTARTARKRKR